jgi:hypothetical protein
MGIDNLIQVFEQDLAKLDKLRATYNGIMPLQFITKKDAKRISIIHHSGGTTQHSQEERKVLLR